LREVFYPVLEFREEKQTFAKVEGDNVEFFHVTQGRLGWALKLIGKPRYISS
jgi:hypothetical protein